MKVKLKNPGTIHILKTGEQLGEITYEQYLEYVKVFPHIAELYEIEEDKKKKSE